MACVDASAAVRSVTSPHACRAHGDGCCWLTISPAYPATETIGLVPVMWAVRRTRRAGCDIAAAMHGGDAGCRVMTQATHDRAERAVPRRDSPVNARVPASSSYSTAPKLNTSDRASSGLAAPCSGDMYAGVPITSSATVLVAPGSSLVTRATPKSSSLACGVPLCRTTMTLAGFRSR